MQIHEVSLAKKTVITEDRTYLLWESVGHKLVEAQLTAQQIQQVFQQAEQGSTDAGGNRTGLGQIKDAGSEVAKAWEQLKTKVQNSTPIKNVDAYYDQAAEKLKQATGGDQGVMRYVEKYRKFAKEHPVAQSFIYAALIAAAGISGAGAGGAAALGLLKMTDKLLQGEKFSSAAYSGAKTGAAAYGAGQLGKALQGTISDMPPDSAYNRPISSYSYNGPGIPVYHLPAEAYDYTPLPGGGYQFVANDNKLAQILSQELGRQVTPGEAQDVWIQLSNQARKGAADMMQQGAAQQGLRESQVRKAFYLAAGLQTQLNEGMWDSIKSAAGKVGQWAKTKGHNLTTRVTTDKLMSAWRSAGSPTDSEAVADVMRNAGVDEQIVQQVLAAVVKAPAAQTAAPAKKHTGGKVAGQTSQTPNAVRQRQARAAKKTAPTAASKPSAGAGAFGQMASQLSGANAAKTPTSTIHRATPNNPNAAYAESYVRFVAESWEEYQVDEALGSTLGKVAGAVAGGVQRVGTAVASPFRNAAAGYRGAKVNSQVNAIADKAYRSWSTYRQQLDKTAPGGKADPATLEKQLLAFVSKNLLGGKYFANLINKDQILGLVKQIAGNTGAPAAPTEKEPPAAQPPGTQPPATKGARMGKVPSAKTPAGKTPTAPAGKTAPGAGAFGQMTNQLGGTAGKTSTGGTATPTATGVKHTASATNPNQPPPPGGGGNPPQKMQVAVRSDGTTQAVPAPVKAPTKQPGVRAGKVPSTPAGATPAAQPITVGGEKIKPTDPRYAQIMKTSKPPIKEALAPAQELELFKKLVAASAQAETEVSTGQGAGGVPSGAEAGSKKVQDPRAMVGDVQKVVGSTVDPGKLKAAGDAIRKNFQIDASIGSTTDDAVDALLIAMGFQPA